MSVERQNLVLGERKGLPFYGENPSIPEKGGLQTRSRLKQVAEGRSKAIIVHPGTGEVLGKASVAFMQGEDVDKQQFVKLYIDGVKGVTGLTKAGAKVLEIVIGQMNENPGSDKVTLSAFLAKNKGLEERTYQRGLRDLQGKEVLFASHAEGTFFINIEYIFNGNRLHYVKSFYLKESAKNLEGVASS
jgi:hypothetical protein